MKFPFWPDMKGYRDIEFGLSRVYALLERLDNPHLKLPPTIHLAGTNGKGSTLAFLKSIFEASGLSIHTYTSPHLVAFNERIVLAGEAIKDDFLTDILTECKEAAQLEPSIPVTFFEGVTVAAFLAFSKVKADILLLETGMGGRLDATNVLDEVLCSVITPIALDHMTFLGNDVAAIAGEKSGIIKKKSCVIVGRQEKEAAQIIQHKAIASQSEMALFGQDWQVEEKESGFVFNGLGQVMSLPFPSLKGKHQIDNAATAIAAALLQKEYAISQDAITKGISNAVWPARLQKITNGAFFDVLPQGWDLYLDGGHNMQAAQTISAFLKEINQPIYVIFAMLKDKDCEGFLSNIADDVTHLKAIELEDDANCWKKGDIVRIAQSLDIESMTAHDIQGAFEEIVRQDDMVATVLVCGSLYLAGEFLGRNANKPLS